MPRLSCVAAFGFADIPTPEILAIFRRWGCRSCQYYHNPQHPPLPADARKIAQDAGLPIDSIHGVFGPQYDLSNPDPAICHAALEAYRREGELAASLGGPRVVVHPAPPVDPHDPPEKDYSFRAGPLRQSLAQLADIGRQIGVTYLVENVPRVCCYGTDPVELATMVRQLGQPNLRMCFDVGHANLTCAVADALPRCADVISYLHVHDNDGKSDSHILPGQGTVPWSTLQPIIERLPQDLYAMLELFQPAAVLREQIDLGLPIHINRWLGTLRY